MIDTCVYYICGVKAEFLLVDALLTNCLSPLWGVHLCVIVKDWILFCPGASGKTRTRSTLEDAILFTYIINLLSWLVSVTNILSDLQDAWKHVTFKAFGLFRWHPLSCILQVRQCVCHFGQVMIMAVSYAFLSLTNVCQYNEQTVAIPMTSLWCHKGESLYM